MSRGRSPACRRVESSQGSLFDTLGTGGMDLERAFRAEIMRLQFHDGAIRAFREHAERQVASHVRDQADKLQGVYDRF